MSLVNIISGPGLGSTEGPSIRSASLAISTNAYDIPGIVPYGITLSLRCKQSAKAGAFRTAFKQFYEKGMNHVNSIALGFVGGTNCYLQNRNSLEASADHLNTNQSE
jgi:hypothetical protein